MPPIEKGDWNRRVFYTKDHRIKLDTAVTILLDCSGSMSGSRYTRASQAVIQLSHTFGRVLKMPVEVLGFTTVSFEECKIYEIKPFGDRRVSADTVGHRLSVAGNKLWGNNDADALYYGYNRLKKRKEPRKMMIVLSDGTPADSIAGDCHNNLVYITNIIEKDPEVDLFGVGIQSTAVKNYYKTHKVLGLDDSITETLFDLIRSGGIKYV